jgi:hypothetical protein
MSGEKGWIGSLAITSGLVACLSVGTYGRRGVIGAFRADFGVDPGVTMFLAACSSIALSSAILNSAALDSDNTHAIA